MATPQTNASKVTGAFLFLRIISPQAKFAVIAYDSSIKKGSKLVDLKKKWMDGGGAGLPYHEKFATMATATDPVWESASAISYGGVFGKSKGTFSPDWPHTTTADQIKDGVYVSYWKFPGTDGGRGLHTSSTTQLFTQDAKVPYMGLYPGSTADLVPSTATFFKKQLGSVYLDWYANFDGDLGWSKESIPA